MKIVEYTVVYDHTHTALIEKVNWLISNGWQPFGVMVSNEYSNWSQPMVKYSPIKPQQHDTPTAQG